MFAFILSFHFTHSICIRKFIGIGTTVIKINYTD